MSEISMLSLTGLGAPVRHKTRMSVSTWELVRNCFPDIQDVTDNKSDGSANCPWREYLKLVIRWDIYANSSAPSVVVVPITGATLTSLVLVKNT